MSADNKRGRERIKVQYETTVKILNEGREIPAFKTRDISLNGVYVNTEKTLEKGLICEVKITLSGSDLDIALDLEGQVARVDTDGMGINFNDVTEDEFKKLKDVVLYNTSDTAEFLRQCRERPKS